MERNRIDGTWTTVPSICLRQGRSAGGAEHSSRAKEKSHIIVVPQKQRQEDPRMHPVAPKMLVRMKKKDKDICRNNG